MWMKHTTEECSHCERHSSGLLTMCEIQTEENNSNSLVSQILLTKNLHNTLNNNIAVIRKKNIRRNSHNTISKSKLVLLIS